MNADITVDSVVYKKSYDLKDESVRQDSALGVNTPRRMSIRSQDYVDSATKQAGRRHTVRFDQVLDLGDGAKVVPSAHIVVSVPAACTSAQVHAVITQLHAWLADDTGVTVQAGMLAVLNEEK